MKIFKILSAKLDLFVLRTQYRNGNFSGHPEYMLDQISSVEYRIRQLKKGRA